MKKSIQFAAVAMLAVLFASCQGDVSPMTSSTKLWPAANKDMTKWGYINEAGTDLVIDAEYGMTYEFSCKRAVASNLSGSEYLVLNPDGKEIPTEALKPGSDMYFYYDCLVFSNSSNKQGMIDVNGKIVFSDEYLALGQMSESKLAWFVEKQGDKYYYGYLKKGEKKEWISAKFDYASTFRDGAAVVMEGDEFGIIDTDGKYLDAYKLSDKYADLALIGRKRVGYFEKDAEACGIRDLNGEKRGSAKFTGISQFTDCNLARVRDEEKKYGYINDEGEVVIRCKYVRAYPFYEGVAWVREEDSNWKLIDMNGDQIFKLRDEDAPMGNYHNGLCLVFKNGTYKYIDKNGDAKDYTWSPDTGGKEKDDAPARIQELSDAEIMASTPFGLYFRGNELEVK